MAAPAIVLSLRALNNAPSSMMGPRPTLIKKLSGPRSSNSASPILPLVSSERGEVTTAKADFFITQDISDGDLTFSTLGEALQAILDRMGSAISQIAFRPNFPAASNSVWRSAGRWSMSRAFCFWCYTEPPDDCIQAWPHLLFQFCGVKSASIPQA